jgi:hypothetical protein
MSPPHQFNPIQVGLTTKPMHLKNQMIICLTAPISLDNNMIKHKNTTNDLSDDNRLNPNTVTTVLSHDNQLNYKTTTPTLLDGNLLNHKTAASTL